MDVAERKHEHFETKQLSYNKFEQLIGSMKLHFFLRPIWNDDSFIILLTFCSVRTPPPGVARKT